MSGVLWADVDRHHDLWDQVCLEGGGGKEATQLNDIPGDIDITYFNEISSTNLSNGSVSKTTRLMMNFFLNGTTALTRDFITETELAAAHQVSVEELYTNISTEELKELYANSGIELVRPVVEEREDAYAGDSGRFLATSFLGLLIDVLIMQPGRVLVVAIIMVILTDQVDRCARCLDVLDATI